jgi:penicillin-insensitive murein DD-endopeptidase
MLRRTATGMLFAMLAALATVSLAADATPAKVLFGKVATAAPLEARSIGFYSRGCLSGGVALPVDGPAWQAMRLSRNRNWGMPVMIDLIERLAKDGRAMDGWPGLLVGDISQPRGGPMLTGHASHQIGLDADIWLTPMPDRTLTAKEREEISAISMIKPGSNYVLDESKWTPAHFNIIKRAAGYEGVERIFVNAGIKKKLCDMAGSDRAWLRRVRPYYLHDAHFHVRLACPPGLAGCKAQDPVPPGDGCGESLAWWLSPAPYKPPPKSDKPTKPAPPMTLASLPPACATVLAAEPGGVTSASVVPLPRPKPQVN